LGLAPRRAWAHAAQEPVALSPDPEILWGRVVGGSVKGSAFGDGGLCGQGPIAQAGGLDDTTRMPAREMEKQS
jgi:hypothetical protein